MNDALTEYRSLLSECRRLTRVKWRLFVRAHCGEPKETHAHCSRSDPNFGRICIAQNDYALVQEGKAATLIHECLHFRGLINHTKLFWKRQEEFFSRERWIELAFPKKQKVNKQAKI